MEYFDNQKKWMCLEEGENYGALRHIVFINGDDYLIFQENPARLMYINLRNNWTCKESVIFEGEFTQENLKNHEGVIRNHLNNPEGLDVTKLDRNKTCCL